jgi:hypothetical protein
MRTHSLAVSDTRLSRGELDLVRADEVSNRYGSGYVRAMIARPADPSDPGVLTRLWYDGWQDAHAAIVPATLTRGSPFRRHVLDNATCFRTS